MSIVQVNDGALCSGCRQPNGEPHGFQCPMDREEVVVAPEEEDQGIPTDADMAAMMALETPENGFEAHVATTPLAALTDPLEARAYDERDFVDFEAHRGPKRQRQHRQQGAHPHTGRRSP